MSSAVASPVRAKIFALAWTSLGDGIRIGNWTDLPGEGVAGTPESLLRRLASILRMARVASWPFMTGMEMSMRMILSIISDAGAGSG